MLTQLPSVNIYCKLVVGFNDQNNRRWKESIAIILSWMADKIHMSFNRFFQGGILSPIVIVLVFGKDNDKDKEKDKDRVWRTHMSFNRFLQEGIFSPIVIGNCHLDSSVQRHLLVFHSSRLEEHLSTGKSLIFGNFNFSTVVSKLN